MCRSSGAPPPTDVHVSEIPPPPRNHYNMYIEQPQRLVGDVERKPPPTNLHPHARAPIQFQEQGFHTDTMGDPLAEGRMLPIPGTTRTTCAERATAWAAQANSRVRGLHSRPMPTPYTHVNTNWIQSDHMCDALTPGNRLRRELFEGLDPSGLEHMHRGKHFATDDTSTWR